jgi:23S rRNA pseudouridine2605 synthase
MGDPGQEGAIRLQKYLAGAGVASRRESETLIAAGRVRVNGQVVREPGTRVVPGRDRVEVDRRPVETAARRWVMLNKAPGFLTTRSDPRGRPTIYDRLPRDLQPLSYVGRLDWGTEGLLLLTNDGDLAHALLHPSRGVEREYRAWVEGSPSPATQQRLRHGVELEDGMARAERVRLVREEPERKRSLVRLVLREGRKREVRRLLEAVGHPVLYLKRVRFGPLELGSLQRGRWRDLEEREVRELEKAARGPAPGARTRGRAGGSGSPRRGGGSGGEGGAPRKEPPTPRERRPRGRE